MPVNDLSLSIHNPLVVYTSLALYGLLTVVLIAYVHAKFRTATKALRLLRAEWQSVQSNHETFVGDAKEKLSKLKAPLTSTNALPSRARAVRLDARHQIVSMAKRGMRTSDIARVCSLQEGEIEVILGVARLER